MKPIPPYEVYIDGASRGNPGPAGIGVVFMDRNAVPVRRLSRYIGETTNNVAEYLALLYALEEALIAGYSPLTVKTDSELLARQINGRYNVRDGRLRLFHGLALHAVQGLSACRVEHIPREQNAQADRLAGEAATTRRSVDDRRPTQPHRGSQASRSPVCYRQEAL